MDANREVEGLANGQLNEGPEQLGVDGILGALLGNDAAFAHLFPNRQNILGNMDWAQAQVHFGLLNPQVQAQQLWNWLPQAPIEVPDDELPNIEQAPEDPFFILGRMVRKILAYLPILQFMAVPDGGVREEIERVFEGEAPAAVGPVLNPQFGPEFANPMGHWLLDDGVQNPAPVLQVELEPSRTLNPEQEKVRNVHGLLTDALYYAKEAEVLEPNAETRQICEMLETRLHQLGERMNTNRANNN